MLTDGKKIEPTTQLQFFDLGNENHLARLLGKFIVVSLLTRKCYVVCHLTNLLRNKCHAKKHDKMEPLLIAIFVKSNIDFNVVLYSVLHLKPQVTDH